MPTDSHLTSSLADCRIISLPRHLDPNGSLTEVENTPTCPFKIKRVYYLYDVPADAERGGHSHYQMQSIMVAVSGSFDVELQDGSGRSLTFTLNRPYQGLYIPAGIWRTVHNFAGGSVCLNIVSEKYSEDDYVRDYDDFLRLTASKRVKTPGVRFPFLDLATVNAPYLDQIKSAAMRVIDSGRYIGGPEVTALEQDIAHISATPYAVGTSNGLDALRLIFRAYIEMGRLRFGDEVIVPADTFIASVLAITDCGLKPVFVDPDITTYNLDPSAAESAITPRTRAILIVHLYGRVCWSPRFVQIARDHRLIIVEDNAQALGAHADSDGLFGTRASGGLGHAGACSFYPTKNIGALGDAGIVTTHDGQLAETIAALRNYGSDRQYHNIYAGLNCRLDPIQAAIVRAKLPYLDEVNAHRRRIANIYSTEITNPLVTLPIFDETDLCVWHQYVVRVDDRIHFRRYLAERGVETAIHYPIAPNMQPCYNEYADLDLPVAEQIARQVVSLPISSCTSEADAHEIAAIINTYAARRIM